jgi:hypothetical protein
MFPTERVRSVGVTYQLGRPTLSSREDGIAGWVARSTIQSTRVRKKKRSAAARYKAGKNVRVTFLRGGGGAYNMLNTVPGSSRGSKIIVWLQ